MWKQDAEPPHFQDIETPHRPALGKTAPWSRRSTARDGLSRCLRGEARTVGSVGAAYSPELGSAPADRVDLRTAGR